VFRITLNTTFKELEAAVQKVFRLEDNFFMATKKGSIYIPSNRISTALYQGEEIYLMNLTLN
jgi:hypothetical protein